MIKKVFFTLVIFFLIISCGKKGDPEYKVSEINFETKNIIII